MVWFIMSTVIKKNSAELDICYAELASKEKLIIESHKRETQLRANGELSMASSKKAVAFRSSHSSRARSLVDRALNFDSPSPALETLITDVDMVASLHDNHSWFRGIV